MRVNADSSLRISHKALHLPFLLESKFEQLSQTWAQYKKKVMLLEQL